MLTTTVYVDFGDNFTGGILTSTVGALRDSVAPGSGTNVNGPTLVDLSTFIPFADATPITMESFNSVYGGAAGAMRADIMAFVRRYFEPLNVTVVELTANLQTVNGINVRGAATMNDVSLTLDANENQPGTDNDTYILVSQLVVGGVYNPAFDGLVGQADSDDLNDRSNRRDDTGIVTLAGNFWNTTLLSTTVAHEAAHNFGLRHTYGNVPNAIPGLRTEIYESDIMSYLAQGRYGGYEMFTRYPMVMGDANIDPNVLSTPTTPSVVSSPYDQLAGDLQVGARPGMTYITGTGANDIITVTRTGANTASVTVRAFTDSSFSVASAIPVPFFGGTTFSYNINLTNPLLIDGGARSDRFIIDANLGQTVNIRGMGGIPGNLNDTDELVINGGAVTATYSPGISPSVGLDGHSDFRGRVEIGTTIVNFQEFDFGSTVTMTGITNMVVRSLVANDSYVLDTVVVAGTTNQRLNAGAVSLLFSGATTLTIDSATQDTLGGDDTITVSAWLPSLTTVTVNTGLGTDVLNLNTTGAAGVTSLSVNTGAGVDTINVNSWWTGPNATLNFALGSEDDTVAIAAQLSTSPVTALTITGDAGDDSLQLVVDTSLLLNGGGSVNFNGGTGSNHVGVTSNAGTTTLTAAGITLSTGATGSITFNSVQRASLGGGGTANSFVINNYTGLTDVQIAGGAGVDALTIAPTAGSAAVYTPSTSAANGSSGTIALTGTNFGFSQFEAGSSMILSSPVTTMSIQTLAGSDNLTIGAAPVAGRSMVSGTTGTATVGPLQFSATTSLTVDTGAFDTATGNDVVTLGVLASIGPAFTLNTGAGSDTINFGPTITGTVLTTLTINGGADADTLNIGTAFTGTTIGTLTFSGGFGDDRLAVNGLNNFALPGGGTLNFNGNDGSDTIAMTNDVATLTLTTASLTAGAAGTIGLSLIENAALTGGAGANTFNVNSWSGNSIALSGAGGDDLFNLGNGNLSNVAAAVVISGGAQATATGDRLVVNDNGTAITADYSIGTTLLTTTLPGGVARPFAGLTFDDTLERLTLTGTTGTNNFAVVPSSNTVIDVRGGGGANDVLDVDFVGTGGRNLTGAEAGDPVGSQHWNFPGSALDPTFGVRADVIFSGMADFNNQLAFGSAGSDPNSTSAPWVKFVDLVSGEVVEFLAYEETFRGGVRVVTADLDGDLVEEIIVAPGRGRAPEIRVFSSVGVLLGQYTTMAFEPTYIGGVNIAVADVFGGGLRDIIAVRSFGNAEVRVFENTGGADPIADVPVFNFLAFPTSMIGGASVTAGNVTGTAKAEIFVGSGVGVASAINVFDPALLTPFAPFTTTVPFTVGEYRNFYAASFLGGVSSMSLGHIDGDGVLDVVVGQGQGGNSLVAMLNGASGLRTGGVIGPTTQVAAQFSAYGDTGNRAAIFVAIRDSDNDGFFDLLFTGQASDGRTRGIIRVFNPLAPFPADTLPLFGNVVLEGITVG